jgi:hypothetical protein
VCVCVWQNVSPIGTGSDKIVSIFRKVEGGNRSRVALIHDYMLR